MEGFVNIKQAAVESLGLWEPITAEQVEVAIAQSPKKTAPGADLWIPSAWNCLPRRAKAVLVMMFNSMELTLQVPVQVLLNIIVVMGKPTGGERPICLTPGFYRLYSKVRKTHVVAWEAAKAGHLDAA
eukprot:8090976-Heterocapsa_arctica.AAC.1